MNVLLLGLVIFFGGHSVSIVNDPWRGRMVAKWANGHGRACTRWCPSSDSFSSSGATGSPATTRWLCTRRLVLRPVAMVLLVPVFPLLLATYLPGRIQAAAQHPMLVATKLWAVAHLLANGMLADVLLFGAFLVWAVLDRISMKHRMQRPVPSVPPSRVNDLIAVAGGLALYAAFVLWLHGWLIGIPLRVS